MMKIKKLDLSHLNVAIQEEMRGQNAKNKDLQDYNKYIEDVLDDSSQSLPNFYSSSKKWSDLHNRWNIGAYSQGPYFLSIPLDLLNKTITVTTNQIAFNN